MLRKPPSLGTDQLLPVEEVNDDRYLQSFKVAVTQVTRQETRHEGMVSGAFKGKNVADARKDDRKRSQSGNHNGASSSRPKFASYVQYNDYQFSKAGGDGAQEHQNVVKERAGMESQGEQAKPVDVVPPKQVRNAVFNSLASHDVAVAGLEVESLSGTEINPEEGEITTARLKENEMEDAGILSNANIAAGLSDETLNMDQEESVLPMSNEEVDGDDLMVTSRRLTDLSKTDEVEETADEPRNASELVEDTNSDMMVSKVDVESQIWIGMGIWRHLEI
ncbi:unnamed protein product [Arabidopsis lyrata]|uniref:uncharacterized protein LOC110225096 isoform X1 n=1 Tax=Arabidopsis lyrata subsp. lyrata TaxID=81972 RepID=UPI000A29CC5F|nr:uncharacterized protein LOC110225096 isoform X1 [Arabidopsis lyrata subsp. lyrata]CAH8256815.1 unnamed protein product [Arabidopsis lyrata]|eukprot:XP_020869504.1 uncharacterized protein LOC110225096 isoform X1 [Arabidopsis lyrata subsp. lyrata]